MLRIKRLYTFIIQTFVPVFIMTFGICLFIVLMQFLWRIVEQLVGKGLDNAVLAELFIYAALQLIPMALPLSLLLASLMAFGNLGEQLELLSIKAAGVSLLKAMRPLIILVAFISIGGFFFQNEAMPRINVKFKTLYMSVRQKSPELDIPEGSFYSGIRNYNLYVRKKNPKTKFLYDVMIYDTSKGFDNMSVFACDSALMRVSENKQFIILNLYSGQRFANFSKSEMGGDMIKNRSNNQFVPYSRENFIEKEIIIPINTGFDRMDESNLKDTYVSKNLAQLNHSIDSLATRLDSTNIEDRKIIGSNTYLVYRNTEVYKTAVVEQKTPEKPQEDNFPTRIDFDSLLTTYSKSQLSQYYNSALLESEGYRANFSLEKVNKTNLQKNIRMHEIERHRKFVLSFACLIFFFIGAPLGAIIRKGGMGMPVVISVLLFIIYYIIDNIGYKLARDGVWEVWQGMWLSSFVLFPLGVFLTYKAMNDSALFNPEGYSRFINRILFIKTPQKMSDEEKADMLDKIPDVADISIDAEMMHTLQEMDSDKLRNVVDNYKLYDNGQNMYLAALSILKDRKAEIGDILEKQDYKSGKELFASYEKSSLYTGIAYLLLILCFVISKLSSNDFIELLPNKFLIVYLILYIRSFIYYFAFYKKMDKQPRKYHAIVMITSLACYPPAYMFAKKKMLKQLEEKKSIIHL